MRGSFFDRCYPHQPEMWLCNRCSEYLSPDPSSAFVGTSNHGTQEHAFKHVQTAYARFDSATMLVQSKFFLKAQYRSSSGRCGSVLIPLPWCWPVDPLMDWSHEPTSSIRTLENGLR